MAVIKPFKGIRPQPDMVEKVASLPYDVLSSDEARHMAADNSYSFLHVTKAEIDMLPGVDIHSEEVYKRSAANFARIRKEGIFIRDDSPCFYVYQLRMGDHVQNGLVVGTSVDEYEAGAIKKHEMTRPEKENDRARHVEMLKANTGPVLFTYRARNDIRQLIECIRSNRKSIYDFRADDGIYHTLWIVSNPEDITDLQNAFKSVEALYVADGHHRTASASRVRNIMRKKNTQHTGNEEYNYFLAVLFPDDELRIMGYHRAVKDLNGLSKEEFLNKISEEFEIETTAIPEPDSLHQFGMYLDGIWYRLVAKAGTFPVDGPVKSSDASILQENLLAPILGITDPRTDNRIDFIGGIRGSSELKRRCNKDMRVAFMLSPVTVEQLMAIADNNAIMPPKSTWFEPKLRSGIVVRSIEN